MHLVADASRLPLRAIGLIAVCAISGFVMMTISLNYWLRAFTQGKGPFTTAAISAISWDIILFTVWLVHMTAAAPNIRFLYTRSAIKLLFVIGLFEAAASLFRAYAALGTAVVLQAVLSSIAVPLTAIFSYLFLPGYSRTRSMFQWQMLMSIGLAIGGATTLVLSSHRRTSNTSPWWPLVFFVGIAVNAAHFVLQERFMETYTNGKKQQADVDLNTGNAALYGDAVESAPTEDLRNDATNNTSDDFTVKICMLAFDTLAQCIATFMMMPMDAIPGYGRSDSLKSTGKNFALGVECIAQCEGNWKYFVLYVGGYAISHFSCVYLNHYSAVLASMVIMMQSPVTTVVLLIAPSLNVTSVDVPVWGALLSCALLLTASLLFGMWESRNKEKREANLLEGNQLEQS